jgi:hypothetical protein
MRKPRPTSQNTPVPDPANPPAAQAALTLEGLYQRRVNLKGQHDQLIANVNATAGALQLCEQLIAQLEAPAPAAEASA